MPPPGRTCTYDSWRPESPKLRCEGVEEENLFLPWDAVNKSTLSSAHRPGESSNGAGSQLVLPKDAAAPDEAKPHNNRWAMLPKPHENL